MLEEKNRYFKVKLFLNLTTLLIQRIPDNIKNVNQRLNIPKRVGTLYLKIMFLRNFYKQNRSSGALPTFENKVCKTVPVYSN